MNEAGEAIKSLGKAWEVHMEKLLKIPAKKDYAIVDTHKQIVEGASKVFFKKGFHPASIREISESAAMTMGKMYHYISSKDDILLLMHRHMQMTWFFYIRDSMIDEIENPYEKLESAIRSTLRFTSENKDLIKFVYTESKYLSKDHLRAVLDVDAKNVVLFFNNLLKKILGKNVSDNYTILGGNMISYLMTFYAMRGWNFKQIDQDEITNFMLEFIFKGLNLSRPDRE